jgi:hypothetical protein
MTPACENGVTLENGRPRVTWVASDPADDTAALTFWVADPEGDAVDVTIVWVQGDVETPLVLAPASPPLIGLPTFLGLNDESGQAHRVIWNLDGVPEGSVDLLITVDDRPREGDEGDTYRVEGLEPRATNAPIAAVLD